MLSILFTVIAPVFLIAFLGWGWVRSGRDFNTPVVTGLVTNIGTPCLIIDTLLKVDLAPQALGQMIYAAAIIHGVFLVVGWVAVKVVRQPVSTFLPGLVFGNTGNMGLPLCLFAFGQEGLALAIAYFVLNAVLLFTLGMQLAAGRASFKELIRTPLIWAVILAVTLLLTDTPLPKWIANTVGLLGGMTIPLMLMALGVSLANLKVKSLGTSLYFSIVRIGMGFSVGWAVAWMMGLEGVALGVVVIESSLPLAVFNYLFAVRYNNRPEEVAGAVVVSTLLSVVALPFILASVM